MSAICGIFYQEKNPILQQTGQAMLDGFLRYYADDRAAWFNKEVFFGYHAQHITPESAGEILPYYDAQNGLVITADAIIDNRQELCDRLVLPDEQRRGLTDSRLILEAYKKWGKDCPCYLVGDFAFVLWHVKRRELFCAVDAVGTRTLYYYHSPRVFAFATLMEPLFALPGLSRRFNESWIADFLAIPSVMHQLDPELTLYKDIYLLPAGHALCMGPRGMQKTVYWQATRRSELKLPSDKAYEDAFLDVFEEAVRCRMRSIRPVGAMMSGGLDSTAVACVAARQLARSGGRLQAFSALPMEGACTWLPATLLADETPYIEAVRAHAGNIDVTYRRAANRHPLSDTNRLFAMLEQPYKIFENLFWIEDIFAAARNKDVGVLLDGSGGNLTISWGDMDSFAVALVKQGKWRLLWREAKAYAKSEQCSLYRTLTGLLLNCLPYELQKMVFRLRQGQKDDPRELSPIRADFARQYQMQKRFRRFGFDPLFITADDRYRMLAADSASHAASIATKQSLRYRTISRDPTMDRRVIEFCLSLPPEQYVRNGQERHFIRRAMQGILPAKVRLNDSVHGVQGADWLERLLPFWSSIVKEIENIGELAAEFRYLDVARIQDCIRQIGVPTSDMAGDFRLRMLLRALIFSRFLRYHSLAYMKGGVENAKESMVQTTVERIECGDD